MSLYLYPRLSDGHALVRAAELQQVAAESPARLRDHLQFEHEQAAPAPTGGTIASASTIARVREDVMESMGPLIGGMGEASGSNRHFDWTLGMALFEHLQIVTSDAAHKGTWNFLSTLVFPDLVWARFPDPSEERLLGGSRNVLRRAWRRFELLGGLEGGGAEELNEDELVQLTERTALARNRDLVHAVARSVIAYDGPRRMDYTRELCKRVTFMTGPLLLDVLSPLQLDDLVGALAEGRRWQPDVPG